MFWSKHLLTSGDVAEENKAVGRSKFSKTDLFKFQRSKNLIILSNAKATDF